MVQLDEVININRFSIKYSKHLLVSLLNIKMSIKCK